MLSGPPSRFFLLGGPSFRSAFHMSELFFAQRFVLGFSLSKINQRSSWEQQSVRASVAHAPRQDSSHERGDTADLGSCSVNTELRAAVPK